MYIYIDTHTCVSKTFGLPSSLYSRVVFDFVLLDALRMKLQQTAKNMCLQTHENIDTQSTMYIDMRYAPIHIKSKQIGVLACGRNCECVCV